MSLTKSYVVNFIGVETLVTTLMLMVETILLSYSLHSRNTVFNDPLFVMTMCECIHESWILIIICTGHKDLDFSVSLRTFFLVDSIDIPVP